MRYSCIAAAIPLWACFALILLIDRSSSFVMPKQLQVGTTNAIDLRDPTLQTSFSKISNHANCKRMQTPSRQYRPTTALQVTAPSAAVAMAVAAFPPLGSLLVLALIVLVHEAGHYLAAKSFGITVEEFSVGVGPKLFGFEAGNDQFNVRALPLGGYVRFPENYNATLVRELELARMNDNSEKPPPPPPKEQEKQQPTSLTASPIIRQVMNFLILGKAEQQRRKQDEKQKLLQEEQEQKNRPWWKRSFSNPVPTSAKPKTTTIRSNRKVDEIAIEYFDDPNLLQNRPWAQRAVVLSMGVVFNLLLSYALCFGEIKWSANGLPQAVFEPGAVVSSIRSDSASRGLLQPGDVIVGINGYPVALSDSRNAIAAQQSISKLISVIRETPEGGAVQLSVIRSPALLPSSTIPPKPVSVKVQPKPVEGNRGPQSIGVMLSPNFVKTSRLHADSWIEAAQLAAKYVGEITSETTSGLVSLFSQVVKGQGAPAGQQISGPIGLIRTGSEVVATKDWNSVVIFATIISINLAVINSLPLPALDGGQLVFVLAEAFTGRKVDQRLQETITSVAFLVLLLATASFAIGDVQNLLGR